MWRPSWRALVRRLNAERSQPAGILIVNGHPDPRPERFCAALCDAYEEGARSAGRLVKRLDAGSLNLDAHNAADRHAIAVAFEKIRWATRFAVIFPLWLDEPPVALRELFSRSRGGTASGQVDRWAKTVITMELPAFAHRNLMRVEQTGGLKKHMTLAGLRCSDDTFIGGIDTISAQRRANWLQTLRNCGKTDE